MTRNPIRWGGFLALPLVLSWVLAAAAATRTVDERVDADADGSVEIDLVSGSVRVQGWDRPQVDVQGTIEEDVERVRVERRGRRVEIEVVRKGDLQSMAQLWSDRVSADLTVRVPAGSDVEVDVIVADIDVEAVVGEVEADAVSGDIRVDGGRQYDLESVSGDIEVRADTADVEAQSVSGDIEIRLQMGSIDAETVSGDVDLRVEALEDGDAESVSGDLDFEVGFASGGRLEAETHSGNIDVSVPADALVSLELETHSGDIRNDLADRQDYRYEFETDTSGRQVRTEDHGDTDAVLELSTFSGDIRIRAR